MRKEKIKINMIEKIFEYGFMEDTSDPNSLVGYGIVIILKNGERHDFKGYEVPTVQNDALKFIIDLYKLKSNT